MIIKFLKLSCFVYDESVYVLDVFFDFLVFINISNIYVDEGMFVILCCYVMLGGNLFLFWFWYCGDMLMEWGFSDGGNWFEVIFIVIKMYY